MNPNMTGPKHIMCCVYLYFVGIDLVGLLCEVNGKKYLVTANC